MSLKKYLPGPESYREFRETGPWTGRSSLAFTMAEDDSDFCPKEDPKFNRFSFYIEKRAKEKLLEHQYEALVNLQEWFREGNAGEALVCMPTGTGKTGVMCCLPYFLEKIGMQTPQSRRDLPTGEPLHRFDKPVLMIAPNLVIADQLEGQILVSDDEQQKNFLLERQIIQESRPYVLPSGVKIEDTKKLQSSQFIKSHEVVIANAQKFLEGKWEEELPNEIFKLVIEDEAHHVSAPTWKRIIAKFRGSALVTFFTAAPFRSDKKPVVEPVVNGRFGDRRFAYHMRPGESFAEQTGFRLIMQVIAWVKKVEKSRCF